MSAKDMFYPEGKNFSDAEERAFAREELVYNVTEDVLVLMEDMDINKKELARRLGKSKSYVSQVLSGARNMTLGSFSDICFAIGVKPQVILPVAEEPPAMASPKKDCWKHEDFRRVQGTIVARPGKVIRFPIEKTDWDRRVA